MKHALIWPDEFGAVDKPKRVKCLEDELAPLNFEKKLRGTPRTCTVCGQETSTESRLCRRPSCAMKRGEV